MRQEPAFKRVAGGDGLANSPEVTITYSYFVDKLRRWNQLVFCHIALSVYQATGCLWIVDLSQVSTLTDTEQQGKRISNLLKKGVLA
jgi:hypothetical protein